MVYLTNGSIQVNKPLEGIPALVELRNNKVPAPLFRLVETWLRKEFEDRQASRKANQTHATGFDRNKDLAPAGSAERTMFTGFSRGAVIPTPNLTGMPLSQGEQTQVISLYQFA